jgi:hypothetical protein
MGELWRVGWSDDVPETCGRLPSISGICYSVQFARLSLPSNIFCGLLHLHVETNCIFQASLESGFIEFFVLLHILYVRYHTFRALGYRSGGPGSIPGTTRKKKVLGLERGPLSLVSTTEELLETKSSLFCLENREYDRRDPSR